MKLSNWACVTAILCITLASMAGPSLPVTKPPLAPVPSWTGPVIDPHAVLGQWFLRADGTETYRTHEFHDNLEGLGGGFAGSMAINGMVSMLGFDAAGNITGFDITATIINDDGPFGVWEEGTNSHGEFVPPGTVRQPYRGTFYDVKLTTSFADDGIFGNFPGPAGPYLGDELSQNIYAIGYDQLAWYCWTPGNPNPDLAPWGSYMVPTWDFGDIPLGAAVSRTLSFGLYAPIDPTNPLYGLLITAYENQQDLFMNRSMSLKISNYFDALSIDPGTPYPVPPIFSSDVSVFHNIPEPASVLLLGLAGLLIRRR